MKRAFDIVVSAAALLALSPLLLIVTVAVLMDGRGPAFFLQRRGGFVGRPFLIYKFRTMTTMDDGKAISQAVRDDPRVTRLGALLRKLSIDELPQLYNVLKGDMSIVGPRPHAVAHDREFMAVAPRYRSRRRARPGITGLAQVSGSRGLTADAASVEARVALDLRYIETWSPLLDVWIIVRTALLMFYDKRAH
ncbi:MAG: sugar transferase [Hyphomonadaceae bacterium]